VATATSADPTPRTAPWIALAKSDVHRIRETIPERAGSLLLVWTELLCIANETGTVSPSATRGTVAKAAGLSRRMVDYCLADLKRLEMLTYDAPYDRTEGRAGPTVYHLTPAADPVRNPLRSAQPVASCSIAQSIRNKGKQEDDPSRTPDGEELPPGVTRHSPDRNW
jgi:hypothetical protein